MHATDLRDLVAYSAWARDRLLDAVERLTPEQYTKPMGSSFASIRDTVVHIYGADWIWTSRLRGEPPVKFPPADTFPDVASVRTKWLETEQALREFLAPLDDAGAARVLTYTSLSFGTASSTIAQIVQHMANHATYHRGQVTTMLRQLDAAPAKNMDLIFFFRERGATNSA